MLGDVVTVEAEAIVELDQFEPAGVELTERSGTPVDMIEDADAS